MKTFSWIIVIALLTGCGGSVSDEQRKQMREASKEQTIVKVTEAEILEAAFEKGRAVVSELNGSQSRTPVVEKEQAVRIHWLAPGSVNALAIEQQLIDAYINSLIEGSTIQDNVQKIGNDSLVYTNPVIITRADSSIEITGTWNVWMSKKQLILGMKEK